MKQSSLVDCHLVQQVTITQHQSAIVLHITRIPNGTLHICTYVGCARELWTAVFAAASSDTEDSLAVSTSAAAVVVSSCRTMARPSEELDHHLPPNPEVAASHLPPILPTTVVLHQTCQPMLLCMLHCSARLPVQRHRPTAVAVVRLMLQVSNIDSSTPQGIEHVAAFDARQDIVHQLSSEECGWTHMQAMSYTNNSSSHQQRDCSVHTATAAPEQGH